LGPESNYAVKRIMHLSDMQLSGVHCSFSSKRVHAMKKAQIHTGIDKSQTILQFYFRRCIPLACIGDSHWSLLTTSRIIRVSSYESLICRHCLQKEKVWCRQHPLRSRE